MNKLVSIAALVCFLTVSAPAFAISQACVDWCVQQCAGKFTSCQINCEHKSKRCVGKGQ